MEINNYDLNKLVKTYDIDNIYEHYKRLEFLEKLKNYIDLSASTVLEFGSATGQMTEILATIANKVVAVDGASEFIKIAEERVKNKSNVEFIESYFESFESSETFDCIILHHIIEHIKEPTVILNRLMKFLKKDGVLVISVPNAYALSRQLAVKMQILQSVFELTENDKNHGHFAVYDWKKLEELITNSNYKVVGRHGLSFKLLSDKQNIEMINQKIMGHEQLVGLWSLGDEIREFAGAIMLVCKK